MAELIRKVSRGMSSVSHLMNSALLWAAQTLRVQSNSEQFHWGFFSSGSIVYMVNASQRISETVNPQSSASWGATAASPPHRSEDLIARGAVRQYQIWQQASHPTWCVANTTLTVPVCSLSASLPSKSPATPCSVRLQMGSPSAWHLLTDLALLDFVWFDFFQWTLYP